MEDLIAAPEAKNSHCKNELQQIPAIERTTVANPGISLHNALFSQEKAKWSSAPVEVASTNPSRMQRGGLCASAPTIPRLRLDLLVVEKENDTIPPPLSAASSAGTSTCDQVSPVSLACPSDAKCSQPKKCASRFVWDNDYTATDFLKPSDVETSLVSDEPCRGMTAVCNMQKSCSMTALLPASSPSAQHRPVLASPPVKHRLDCCASPPVPHGRQVLRDVTPQPVMNKVLMPGRPNRATGPSSSVIRGQDYVAPAPPAYAFSAPNAVEARTTMPMGQVVNRMTSGSLRHSGSFNRLG